MNSLQVYEGTVVFVSHDRYFLDGLATKVLEIGNQTAVQYPGNYEDYVLRKAELERDLSIQSEKQAEPVAQTCDKEGEAQPSNRRKKVNPYKIRQIKERIEKIEAKIQLHETRVSVLTQLLASEDLYRDHQLFRSTLEEHDHLEKELNRLMEQWEAMHAELEFLEACNL